MKIERLLRFYAVVGISVLSFLAVSCDKDAYLEASGETVAVRIHSLGIQNREAQDFVRSGGRGEKGELAFTSLPMADGHLLEMSLEAGDSELRATNLEVNKTFRVIALRRDNKTYVSHADFTVNSLGTPYTSPDLHVLVNVAHDFICISYNNTSPIPALSGTVGQVLSDLAIPADGRDLLYDRMENQAFANDAEASLSFVLRHQLSKVKVIIDCTYNSWEIGALTGANAIRVAPIYNAATMKYADGTITKGTAATNQYFASWTAGANNYTQTSEELSLFTNGEAISVILPANSLTINSVARPTTLQTLTFPIITALAQGGRYILRVRFRSPMFANSNIYWVATDASNGCLAFDPYVDPASSEYATKKTEQQKQGVGFKWGSLVGVSVPGFAGVREIAWNDTASIYVPTSPTVWARTTVTAAVAGSKWSGTGYDGIPYVQDNGGPVFDRENNYLTTLGTADNALYKGDICKYLDNSYRMPYSNEFGPNNGAWKDWTGIPHYAFNPINEVATQIDGQTLLPPPRGASMRINDMHFPALGLRIDGGNVKWVGTMLQYWSSSPSSATEGNCLSAHLQACVPGIQHDRRESMAVRCVLAD
jgi:hypothetical protein